MKNTKLELLADDFQTQATMDVLKKQPGVNVEVYFDNSDVRSMVLGLRSFEYRINKEKLKSMQVLVHSLAYFGIITNIRMLAPHQDELLDYLSKKYLLPIYTSREADQSTINELLGSAELLHIDKLKEYIDQNKIKQYLNGFKHKSIELFKVNYYLKDFHWLDRLKKVVAAEKSSVVQIDESSYNFGAAISTKIFKDLVKAFDEERDDKLRNNFRDALALTLIKLKIDDFKSGKSISFPLFYATTKVIRAIREREALYNEFNVEANIGDEVKTINVLRDSYYFILDVLFNIVSGDKNVPGELFEHVQSFRNKFSNMSFSDLSSTSRLETELEGLLFRDKFFYEFWFKKIDAHILSEYVSDLVDYDFFKTNATIKRKIDNGLKVFKDRLSENLHELKMTEFVWATIDALPGQIDDIFTKNRSIDVVSEVGMARFSLENHAEIQGIFDTILAAKSDKGENFLSMQVQLTNYIVNGIFAKKVDELTIGIAILWMFNRSREICEILGPLNFDYGDHYQLALLHAASVYQADHEDKSIVTNILAPYQNRSADEQTYKLNIGMSFIYYQVWKLKSNRGLIPEEPGEDVLSRVDHYMETALTMAESAYDWLKTHRDDVNEEVIARNSMYYYAMNNLLYFRIRSQKYSKPHMAAWKAMASRLQSVKGEYPQYWQSRFDHTLALYEYRVHVIQAQLQKETSNHLLRAQRHITNALRGVAVRKYDYEVLEAKINNSLEDLD